MLYIAIGSVAVYIVTLADPSRALYNALTFDRAAILSGQVWRLFSYVFLGMFDSSTILFAAVMLLCYYQIGQALENAWGKLRFTLYYLTGLILLDVAGLALNIGIGAGTLNLTLFLAFATLYPDTQFMLFFIIPVKARWIGLFSLAMDLLTLLQISQFPYNLTPLFALANYFLFLGKDFLNIFPVSWRINASRLGRRGGGHRQRGGKTIPFGRAGSFEAGAAPVKGPYTHRCTVCGRTDQSNPELEFRYCSKCKGYYCYCSEHINNHTHIQ